jgi:hypothetical protein
MQRTRQSGAPLMRGVRYAVVPLADLRSRLSAYPLSSQCFSRYVEWLVAERPEGLHEFDVIRILDEGDPARLASIENRLQESRKLLEISDEEFARAFGFNDDLLSQDPARIHDILAEPMFVPDLAAFGFRSISKLPPFIQVGSNRLRNADFSAERGPRKFAIELKTIRMENRPPPEPGRPLGDSMQPDWWGNMFRSNARTKIEDKNRRVLEQLANAKARYHCDKSILALYTRRVGPSALMTRQDYGEELANLCESYSEVDHFICKDYFGAVEIYPQL